MAQLPTLPPPLFARVVAFAVPGFADDALPTRGVVYTDLLKPLALVAKAWVAPVREVGAAKARSSLTLAFQSATRSEVVGMRRRMVLCGKHLRSLRVSMGSFASFGEYFAKHHGLHFVDDAAIDWDALLVHAPLLRRLDLSTMPMGSPHIRQIIESAAKYCEQLEALILPGKERQNVEADMEIEPVMTALYGAMKHWRARGGLRQLTVPNRTERDRLQSTQEFLEHVIEHCPNIGYLDGYKQSLREMDRLTCHDQWILTLPLWQRFNAACTKLKEFNWVVVPFADPFFKVFGEHTKPELSSLVFSVNMLWDWASYFRECGEGGRINVYPDGASRRGGYGFKATDASAALKGCPNLRSIEIGLYHPLDPEVLDNPEMAFDGEYDFLANTYPDNEVLNQNIFDDKFCETAVACCTQLDRFSIWEVVEGYNSGIEPIETLTDRGLVALSKLEYLTVLELRSVNCTGEGVFDFLSGLSDAFTGQRTLQIALGGSTPTSQMDFYNGLLGLLDRIDRTPPSELSFADRKFVLRVSNSSLEPVDRGWSGGYMKRLETLVKNVKAQHPSLRIRITTSGRVGDTIASVIELGLYTTRAEPSVWYGWDDEQPDRNVSFANRGGAASALQGGFPLDPDSLPLDYEFPSEFIDGYDDEYGEFYDDYGDYYDDYDDAHDLDDDDFWEDGETSE
jgi:hypothetical protein